MPMPVLLTTETAICFDVNYRGIHRSQLSWRYGCAKTGDGIERMWPEYGDGGSCTLVCFHPHFLRIPTEKFNSILT